MTPVHFIWIFRLAVVSKTRACNLSVTCHGSSRYGRALAGYRSLDL